MAWFLVRQDTHGTRYDVASYATEGEANDAMAEFESGYPHHQTYYVEDRTTVDSIATISAVEAIRQRPEMYVGEGGAALTDLVFEALCLSLTEAHCGTASEIRVGVTGADIEITNDGAGLSLDTDQYGIPFAEAVMTTLYACRDHKEHEQLKHELCGVGIVVVNALSQNASVSISHGTGVHEQTYTRGEPDAPFATTSRSAPSGTRLRFTLDRRFLRDETFDQVGLQRRLAELEIDLEGVAITFTP